MMQPSRHSRAIIKKCSVHSFKKRMRSLRPKPLTKLLMGGMSLPKAYRTNSIPSWDSAVTNSVPFDKGLGNLRSWTQHLRTKRHLLPKGAPQFTNLHLSPNGNRPSGRFPFIKNSRDDPTIFTKTNYMYLLP